MSLAIKYESLGDVQMRLRHTVVKYKDHPVYIREISNGTPDEIFRVHFDPLPFQKPKTAEEAIKEAGERKYISSKHFDIAPFKLGYVNRPEGVFYCSRLPNRMQKQGLCAENFQARDHMGSGIPFMVAVNSKEFVAMVQNNYPSFEIAFKALNKVKSVAFSRDFALERDDIIEELIHLYHKGSKVGGFLGGKIVLGQKYVCLRESLIELGVNF